jgi:two-component system, NarL family, response regulator DevR
LFIEVSPFASFEAPLTNACTVPQGQLSEKRKVSCGGERFLSSVAAGATFAGAGTVIRVLLLEPDGWRFRGMWSVLRDSGEIDVVGELDYARVLTFTRPPESLAAEVVVIAHRLLLEYGIALVPMLREVFAPCNVMVHGEADHLELTAQMYAAGARGYFPLASPPGLLVKGVVVVNEGKYWGPREAVALMAERVLAERAEEEAGPPSNGLDPDDRMLLALLNEGLSNKEIGQRMGLAEPTIKTRFNRLYKHFGVATRLQLLSSAISRKLVHPR